VLLFYTALGSGFETKFPQAPLEISKCENRWLFENCEFIPSIELMRVPKQCQLQVISGSLISPDLQETKLLPDISLVVLKVKLCGDE